MNETIKKARAEEFLKLFKEKEMTYEKIGEIYGFTKVLVYKELKKYFQKEVKEVINQKGWYVGKRKPAKELVEYTCKICGKKKKSNYRYYTPKFCSRDCQSNFMKRP